MALDIKKNWDKERVNQVTLKSKIILTIPEGVEADALDQIFIDSEQIVNNLHAFVCLGHLIGIRLHLEDVIEIRR